MSTRTTDTLTPARARRAAEKLLALVAEARRVAALIVDAPFQLLDGTRHAQTWEAAQIAAVGILDVEVLTPAVVDFAVLTDQSE